MNPRLPLSAFIICLNEEAYLGNCIESLAQCAEIVIVDSGSTDGTVALVQSYIDAGWPIRFMHEAWRGYAGQDIGVATICDIRDRAAALLRDAGYVASVQVPVQTIESGTVQP